MTPWNPHTAGCLEAVAVGVVLLLLSAMLDGAPISAQTPEQSSAGEGGTVAGHAIDFRNTPVVDATVFLTPDAGQTASTDSEGRFRLAGVPAGRYTIEARTSGLTSGTKEITVRAGETTEVELSLVPAEQTADQIDVTSGYSVNRSDPVSATPLSSEELHELPNFGNDMVRAVRYLPGVSGNDVSAQFNVRGGLYRENMVRIDGLEVFEPYHLKDFQGVFSIFDPQMLGEVEVLTGGFPSEFGDRMTGILDLTTADPSQRRRYDLGISLSTASASGVGTFADGRGRWLGSLRRGWLDLVLQIAGPDEDEQQGDGPAYWDAHGRVDYQLTPSQSLTANLLTSDDTLDEEETEDEDGIVGKETSDTSYGNSYIWATHQGMLGSNLLVDSLISAGQIDRDRRVSEDAFDRFQVRDERDADVYSLRQDWGYLPSPRHFLKWGFEARTYDTQYDYVSDLVAAVGDDEIEDGEPQTREFAGDFSGDHYALYLADRIRLSDSWTVELGLRYDRQSLLDEDQISPRVNTVFDLGGAGVLKAAWGHFHQSQRPHELQVEDGETQFQPAERAVHYLLGWERPFRLGERSFNLRADAYYRKITDPRVRFENLFRPFEPNPEVRRDRIMIAAESAEARGLELFLASRSGGRLNGWAHYSYAEVTDRIDRRDVPRNIDQRHALTLNANYQPGRKWTYNFTWTYHSGWPTTAVDAVAVQQPDGTLEAEPLIGPIYAENLGDYHRLDMRASRRFFYTGGSELELFIDVQNLYDQKNSAGFEIDERNFMIRPGGQAIYEPKPEYWLGILPTAGVVWRFGK